MEEAEKRAREDANALAQMVCTAHRLMTPEERATLQKFGQEFLATAAPDAGGSVGDKTTMGYALMVWLDLVAIALARQQEGTEEARADYRSALLALVRGILGVDWICGPAQGVE